MTSIIQHFINGKLTSGQSESLSDVFNPALGKPIRNVHLSNKTDIDHVVNIAKTAQLTWQQITPLRRARILFKFKQLILEHLDELAYIITEEHGKVLSDARGEMTRGMEVVEFACGIPHLLKGDYSANVGSGIDCYTLHQPVGVCVGITPFNFPAMVPMWMFPIAIACGNSFILKPSERNPSIANRLANLFKQAGLPDGVFNVIHGDKLAVDTLLNHPDVNAISFVGSTPIAKYIYKTASSNGKRVQALGGAKNHCVVMPDADIELAANGLMGAAYGSAGERCMAISVAVAVGDRTADALVSSLINKLTTLRIKPGTEEDAEMGPLITSQHRQRVIQLVSGGIEEGAELVVDGRDFKVKNANQGFFLGGCLFDRVTPEMTIYKEEIFGPVLCVVRVNSFDDAIQLINNNPYANGTAIYTQNGAAGREFATRITVGMVGINVPIPVPMAFHSFGGWKNSLFGSSAIHGTKGIQFYTRLKTVTTRWPTKKLDAEFTIPIME